VCGNNAADIPGVNDISPMPRWMKNYWQCEVHFCGQAVAVAATDRDSARGQHAARVDIEELRQSISSWR
jgi:xanthine dehydrogenase molybdopterin-binding subunit B